MSSRSLFAAILMACLLAIGTGGASVTVHAASVGPSVTKHDASVTQSVTDIGYRGRKPRAYLPMAPSYLAYDYPYYYSRGYYPTHIGPGYIHHGYLYAYPSRPYAYQRRLYKRAHHPRYGARCAYKSRKCAYRAYR